MTTSARASLADNLVTAPRALLLIDVPGSLRLTRELGDIEAYRLLKAMSGTFNHAPTMARGRVARRLGDGFLLVFDSVADAAAHAIAVQRGIQGLTPAGCSLKVRCAIHHGPVLEADGDVFGEAVYLTSRVCGHAHGGEILLTGQACQQAGDVAKALNPFGPTLLPGFEDPVPLFELPWRDIPRRDA